MRQDTWMLPSAPAIGADKELSFTTAGETSSALVGWFTRGLLAALERHGHAFQHPAPPDAALDQHPPVRLVVNLCDLDSPRPVHRRGQGTFVATIVEGEENQREIMKAAYPLIVRSLANMVVYLTPVDGVLEAHFVTIEQGHYTVRLVGDELRFFDQIYGRIQPLACSHLVINNEFVPDLPEQLWQGDATTRQIGAAGKKLDAMGLLPAVTPIHEYLSERELRHVKRLYGIGGLSYGNLSARARHHPAHFWMSASGVDKGKLETVGRDMLLVTDYVPEKLLIRLSVPAIVEPRRVSVDAIEHFMIYREHPQVGAIVHVHAWWRDPIPSTEMNYPCGTYELAAEVAELVRHAPDPARAVIGLKNHGLTITGVSIEEIFERIDGMIVPQVPMS
jgi:ribulose-5-phosphate 4-epimerase/fuculose-1-phosphate aldolase